MAYLSLHDIHISEDLPSDDGIYNSSGDAYKMLASPAISMDDGLPTEYSSTAADFIPPASARTGMETREPPEFRVFQHDPDTALQIHGAHSNQMTNGADLSQLYDRRGSTTTTGSEADVFKDTSSHIDPDSDVNGDDDLLLALPQATLREAMHGTAPVFVERTLSSRSRSAQLGSVGELSYPQEVSYEIDPDDSEEDPAWQVVPNARIQAPAEPAPVLVSSSKSRSPEKSKSAGPTLDFSQKVALIKQLLLLEIDREWTLIPDWAASHFPRYPAASRSRANLDPEGDVFDEKLPLFSYLTQQLLRGLPSSSNGARSYWIASWARCLQLVDDANIAMWDGKSRIVEHSVFKAVKTAVSSFLADRLVNLFSIEGKGIDQHEESDLEAEQTLQDILANITPGSTNGKTDSLDARQLATSGPFLKDIGHRAKNGTRPAVTQQRTVRSHRRKKAFDVDVVGVKVQLTGPSYILRTQKPKQLPVFVLRDALAFDRFRSRMAHNFPKAGVKSLPPSNATSKVAMANGSPSIADDGQAVRNGSPLLGLRSRALSATETTDMVEGREQGSESGSKVKVLYEGSRRALRSWLRDTLSIVGAANHPETYQFLHSGEVTLKDKEKADVDTRKRLDRLRNSNDLSESRVKMLEAAWGQLRDKLADSASGAESEVTQVLSQLRESGSLAKLPLHYRRVFDLGRLKLARFFYACFIEGAMAKKNLQKLKDCHAAMPWFLLKQASRLPNAAAACRALMITKPIASSSPMEKIMGSLLEDDPSAIAKGIAECKKIIQSNNLMTKLRQFVHSGRSTQQQLQETEPLLDDHERARVMQAAQHYRDFLSSKPTTAVIAASTNTNVRLIRAMNDLLGLFALERDASEIRRLLDDPLAADIVGQILDLIRAPRLVKACSLSALLSNCQVFWSDLIAVCERATVRIAPPHRHIRSLNKLLESFQDEFYTLVHRCLRKDLATSDSWSTMVQQLFIKQSLDIPYKFFKQLEAQSRWRFIVRDLERVILADREDKLIRRETLGAVFADDFDSSILIESDGKGRARVEPYRVKKASRQTSQSLKSVLDIFVSYINHL